jgi:hypothetical protein
MFVTALTFIFLRTLNEMGSGGFHAHLQVLNTTIARTLEFDFGCGYCESICLWREIFMVWEDDGFPVSTMLLFRPGGDEICFGAL